MTGQKKTQRRRVWMDFNTAANSVDEPDLKVLLSDFGTMLNEDISCTF